jgi:hypothetical protein
MKSHIERTVFLKTSQQNLLEQKQIPQVFSGRGFTLEQLHTLNLGLDEQGNAVIPLHSLEGNLVGLKLRLLEPNPHKYLEIPHPNGNPPWFAPNILESKHGILCIEGELNAMITYLALALALEGQNSTGSNWGIVGLGSTFGPVPWDLLKRLALPVVFYVDPGRAGDKSLKLWLERAKGLGLQAARAEPLHSSWDACQYADLCGLEGLGLRWAQILRRI